MPVEELYKIIGNRVRLDSEKIKVKGDLELVLYEGEGNCYDIMLGKFCLQEFSPSYGLRHRYEMLVLDNQKGMSTLKETEDGRTEGQKVQQEMEQVGQEARTRYTEIKSAFDKGNYELLLTQKGLEFKILER